MPVSHSKNLIIRKEDLLEIGAARLRESELMLSDGQHAGSMFLGGCSLECYLKAAVCVTLKLDGLPAAFKTHDLEVLILYSGFQRDLQEEPPVKRSFDDIVAAWGMDGRKSLLYAAPSSVSVEKAKRFHLCLTGMEVGVIPWLRRHLS